MSPSAALTLKLACLVLATVHAFRGAGRQASRLGENALTGALRRILWGSHGTAAPALPGRGETRLLQACRLGRTDLIEQLIKLGADPNLREAVKLRSRLSAAAAATAASQASRAPGLPAQGLPWPAPATLADASGPAGQLKNMLAPGEGEGGSWGRAPLVVLLQRNFPPCDIIALLAPPPPPSPPRPLASPCCSLQLLALQPRASTFCRVRFGLTLLPSARALSSRFGLH